MCRILLATVLLSVVHLSTQVDWDGLRVTWGLNPFSSYTFASMPRTAEAARNKGWTLETSCSDTNYFKGNRYILNGDTSVMLLFDKNGFIAGIQSGIEDGKEYPPSQQIPPMHHETAKSMYTITAYFVDPATVCSTGRTQAQFNSEGTGTKLLIQNGNTMQEIPRQVAGLSGTQWTKGRCFWTMGQHYWWNIRADMPCEEFFPVFLLYNSGKLNAFGFAFQGDFSSPRYEHPTYSVVPKFLNPVPTCLKDVGVLSTMHIYLDDSPRTNFC